ncbi:hypothetical protein OF83DRAFT_1051989 [Amylostereum chailletii]|nr:hypothetical protein OF83DRAFT_1051989 [Amylostereum chailletii]
MVALGTLLVEPPLLNSSCPWASEIDQLQALYDCPSTGAVTTRTAILTGYVETASNGVVFTRDTVASQNSYGHSPHPLTYYIDAVERILTASPETSTKPFIISITSSSPLSLANMLDAVQALRARLGDAARAHSRVGIELNTSCPNIQGSPPPAFVISALAPLLAVLTRYARKDPTFAIGLKLPPYTYQTPFDELVRALTALSFPEPSPTDASRRRSPFAFLTTTNTLGQTILFESQVTRPEDQGTNGLAPGKGPYALPTPLGGLGGDPIHALSLGNVHTFRRLLDQNDEALRAIVIVGVGGVTSKDAHRRMRAAGAGAVACATLFGREGIRAFEMVSLEDDEADLPPAHTSPTATVA